MMMLTRITNDKHTLAQISTVVQVASHYYHVSFSLTFNVAYIKIPASMIITIVITLTRSNNGCSEEWRIEYS
jgi:hypothetical protein